MENSESCDRGACWGTILKGALVGALVLFVYFTAAWTLFKSVTPAKPPVAAEKATAEKPVAQEGTASAQGRKTPQELEAVLKKLSENIRQKPPQRPEARMTTPGLIKGFILYFLAAAALTGMMKDSAEESPHARFALKAGVLVAILHHAPAVMWHTPPLKFIAAGMATDIVGVTLAGLAISCLVLKNCRKSA